MADEDNDGTFNEGEDETDYDRLAVNDESLKMLFDALEKMNVDLRSYKIIDSKVKNANTSLTAMIKTHGGSIESAVAGIEKIIKMEDVKSLEHESHDPWAKAFRALESVVEMWMNIVALQKWRLKFLDLENRKFTPLLENLRDEYDGNKKVEVRKELIGEVSKALEAAYMNIIKSQQEDLKSLRVQLSEMTGHVSDLTRLVKSGKTEEKKITPPATQDSAKKNETDEVSESNPNVHGGLSQDEFIVVKLLKEKPNGLSFDELDGFVHLKNEILTPSEVQGLVNALVSKGRIRKEKKGNEEILKYAGGGNDAK